MELTNSKIIVTGGARGMGAATVRAYAAAGAHVVSMDVEAEAGQSIAETADRQSPGTVRFVKVDISDDTAVNNAFDSAVELMGGLDALAHPAAIQQQSDAASVTMDDWNRVMQINVGGTVLTNQAAYRHMKDTGGGSIINFGSVSGLRPEPVAAAYSASKGAVHSWTRTAAAAWGADSVRVNAILPAIATPMYDAAKASFDTEQLTAHFWQNEHSIALGKAYGDPDRDLGPVMVFLASDASRFITGQLLPVDGGQTSVR